MPRCCARHRLPDHVSLAGMGLLLESFAWFTAITAVMWLAEGRWPAGPHQGLKLARAFFSLPAQSTR